MFWGYARQAQNDENKIESLSGLSIKYHQDREIENFLGDG